MAILFSYICLGLSLAAPIGPLNAAQLDKGMKLGFFHSWFLGLGSMTADVIYMLAVYFGLVSFIEVPIIKIFLWIFGAFVLIYTGIEGMFNKISQVSRSSSDETLFKSFTTGFLISLSNPLTIIFWLGVYGSVLAKNVIRYQGLELVLYSSAILFGLFLWDIMMAFLSSFFGKFLSEKTIPYLSKSFSIILIGFGLYFGYQGLCEWLY